MVEIEILDGNDSAEILWGDCERNARDDIEEEMCNFIKESSIELIGDPDTMPPVNEISDINEGYCGYIIQELVGYLESMEPDMYDRFSDEYRVYSGSSMGFIHYWIEYNGKHFDAEAPSGVYDWRDLPSMYRFPNTRHSDPIIYDSIDDAF